MAPKQKKIYQIKVSLDHIHPPIWRRIQVPENITLLKLHDILQIVMGWENYHLHEFTIRGQYYGDPADDEYGDRGTINEKHVKLRDVIPAEGQRFHYQYDFGDSWDHTLLVEKILPAQKGVRYPRCVKGLRACPPEDVGGPYGYMSYLQIISDPEHENHEEYLQWRGEFDPEAFDLQAVNQQLNSMGKGASAERDNYWALDPAISANSQLEPDADWVQNLPPEQLEIVENLALRQDALSMLNYIGEQRPKGTQSTGNLPLKAVRAIAARFIDPPATEETIGDTTVPARSEAEVVPIFWTHVLISVAALAQGGPGRQWRLTPLGEQFIEASPPVQFLHLFQAWRTKMNWEAASPFWFEIGTGQPYFKKLVLASLLQIPVGTEVWFLEYAGGLIREAGLDAPSQNARYGRQLLHNVIEMTALTPLVNFGVLNGDYTRRQTGFSDVNYLRSFTVTNFGHDLLSTLGA